MSFESGADIGAIVNGSATLVYVFDTAAVAAVGDIGDKASVSATLVMRRVTVDVALNGNIGERASAFAPLPRTATSVVADGDIGEKTSVSAVLGVCAPEGAAVPHVRGVVKLIHELTVLMPIERGHAPDISCTG
jgi:hypothetical protein